MKAFLDSFWICWALGIHVVQDIHVDPCGPVQEKGEGQFIIEDNFATRQFLIHDHN